MVVRELSYAALLSAARPFLANAVNTVGRVLILGSVRQAVDDLARSSKAPATRGVYRQTLHGLIVTLSDRVMNERGLVPIGRLTSEALAARVVANRRGQLRYLAPVSTTPGFPKAVARTLTELRLNGISAECVHDTGRSGPCLSHLLTAYQQELASCAFADAATRTELALEQVRRGTHELCGVPLICLDLRPWSKLERQLVDALISRSPSSLMLELDLQAGAAVCQEPATCLHSLRRRVLAGTREPAFRSDEDDTVTLFSASGEALECAEIVRRILQLAEAGYRFDQLAVLLRNGRRYRGLLEEAFTRAGVPVWFTEGTGRPDRNGRGFLSLLRCRAEGLSASRFAEYLSLGVVPREEEDEGRQRFTRRWERLLLHAGVFGGRERWRTRLAGSIAERELKWDSDDESERNRAVRDVAALESLRGFALPIIELLDSLPENGTWADWIEALSVLARRTLNTPDAVLDTLEKLAPMADLGPVTTADVIGTLVPELTTTCKQSDADRYGKVFAGNIDEAVGLSFVAVFLPGMNEGIFPAVVREDPLLLDSQRVQLAMPRSEDDGLLLRTAIACASGRFTASWSRVDLGTGRERVPSFYAFEIAEAAWGGDIDPELFEREAGTRTETRLGWPAPVATNAAIDDAEYDLAWLRGHWHTETPGSAAWLKLANPHVHRALQARWWRWDRRWKWSDGLVAQDWDLEAAVVLDRQFSPRVHAFRATDLQEYARCPYRFLLRAIYRLAPADQFTPIQRMSPAVRGTLFHAAQEGVLALLRDGGLLPVTPESLPEALDVLDSVLLQRAAQMKEKLAPAIEPVWDVDTARLRGDLRGWLRFMALSDRTWTPEQWEYEFSSVRLFDSWLLSGRLDLIESAADGRLRVTDHKTGKAPEKKERPECIGGGEVLQPVLYALAAEQALGQTVSESRLFYANIRNNYCQIPIALTAEARNSARNVFAIVENAIRDGFLPAAPREKACQHCDYLPVCGPYEEERVTRKRYDEIRDLVNLRNTP